MAYEGFKDFSRRAGAEKVLWDKAFNIAKNPKYYGYECRLASFIYKFFDKKSSDSGVKNKIIPNQELGEELHKSIIKKFEKRKIYSSFKDNSSIQLGGNETFQSIRTFWLKIIHENSKRFLKLY